MTRALLFLLAAVTSPAHVMSMSTGDLKIDQHRAHYELRMPLYEMAHVAGSEQALFDHIRFSSGGSDATFSKSCNTNQTQGIYFCTADYEFRGPVDKLEVACTFHVVTVGLRNGRRSPRRLAAQRTLNRWGCIPAH